MESEVDARLYAMATQVIERSLPHSFQSHPGIIVYLLNLLSSPLIMGQASPVPITYHPGEYGNVQCRGLRAVGALNSLVEFKGPSKSDLKRTAFKRAGASTQDSRGLESTDLRYHAQ
jgi:hypothetical protein